MTNSATGTPLVQLAARLEFLAASGHPLGLRRARAERLVAEAEGTGELGPALARVGGDRRLVEVLARARPGDAVAVVGRLLPAAGAVAALQRRVAATAAYPLVLLVTVSVSALLGASLGLPALSAYAAQRGAEVGGAVLATKVAVGLAALLLLGLAGAVRAGWRLPPLTRGAEALERVLVLETASALHATGTALPLACSAAGAWARGPVGAAAAALARALDAGATPGPAAPLLDAESTALLASAASQGLSVTVLGALAEQARLAAERQVPQELARVSAAAVLLAGLALLAVAATWWTAYLHAVAA